MGKGGAQGTLGAWFSRPGPTSYGEERAYKFFVWVHGGLQPEHQSDVFANKASWAATLLGERGDKLIWENKYSHKGRGQQWVLNELVSLTLRFHRMSAINCAASTSTTATSSGGSPTAGSTPASC